MCGKATHSSNRGCVDIQLCNDCLEKAGLENEHYDGYHQDNPDKRCLLCKTEARKKRINLV
jgi:hypothetical protein